MARYRGQKALYEVIGGRARNKSARPVVEPLKPTKPQLEKPVVKKIPVKVQAQPQEKAVVSEKRVISWKPKPLQYHDGRIEITLPTKVAVTVFLGLVVTLLACFKAGQFYPDSESGTLIENNDNVSSERIGLPSLASARQNLTPESESEPEPAQESPVPQKMIETVNQSVAELSKPPVPGNAIVIQEFSATADLIAVGRFFASLGIPTEIVSKGDVYYLITEERFHYDPATAPQHTTGYKLLEEIRLSGHDYKAPQGLEPFARNKFKGAYGRKIDDQYIGEVTNVH